MNVWEMALNALPPIAAVAATAASFATGLASASRAASVRRERDDLRKADTEAAIESADLPTLGFHLVERLGSASVRNYLSDEEVRGDFNRAFSAVRTYLGESPPDEARSEASLDDADNIHEAPNGTLLDQLSAEDVWTPLARARRDLESALTEALSLPEVDRRRSATQMLPLAEERQLLSTKQAAQLRAAVTVANRAIHGSPVSPDSAARALTTFGSVLDLLAAKSVAKKPKPTRIKQGNRMHVVRDESTGEWKVQSPARGGKVSHHKTQREAIDTARDMIYNSGGGEVVIHGRTGRIENTDTVASRSGRQEGVAKPPSAAAQ